LSPHTVQKPHIVHVHRDREFLLDAVTEYFEIGLQGGEAGIVIARQDVRRVVKSRFGDHADLHFLDAERTLARFMSGGMPDWHSFVRFAGGVIAHVRLDNPPGVRVYGEMVDVLWQRGEREAALRLEEYWNELGRLQTFSLFCAYHLDSLDDTQTVERICAMHTHFIPARDHSRLDAAIVHATQELLDPQFSSILPSLASVQENATEMPLGHATLLWLARNMPRTAERVLERVRAAEVA